VRHNEQGKWRAWTHHHLGQETWLLRRFHGEKDRRKCDSEKFFDKHSACIVCTEKMAMECRRLSTKVNGETRERLGESAQRSTTVRGQAGKGATVASRVRPSRTSGFSAC
jgi:hypothetical protein